ncbi:MAG TPA: LemA family protein [Longimicrobiales bacterium]|nr:LemA family protein [Longimicrobiales bacterium]
MGIVGYVFIGLAIVGCVYFATIYNNLVRLKHTVTRNWSNIDVLLKQRHDELPNLVETCKGYMKHERETLEAVMRARSAVASARQARNVAALGPAEGALRMGLGSLFAVAEAYPDLKANQSFQHVQTRISQMENAIADRRELYNATVNNLNIRIEQFPDVIVANQMGFKPADLLEFDEADLANVDVKQLLDR